MLNCLRDTDNSEFIFCAGWLIMAVKILCLIIPERLMKMVIELGLNQLPYEEILIKTPNASSYSGIKFKRGNTGVSINRSGESFENALRQCCRSIRIGKILIGDDQQVLYTRYFEYPRLRTLFRLFRFMGDIRQRRVLLLYPVLRTGSTVLTAISLLLRNHVKEENIILVTLFSNLKCEIWVL